VIALAVLLACGPKSRAPESSVEAPPLSPVALNGAVADGAYRDGALPLVVPIPEGWTAQPGPTPSALRVTLSNAALDVRLEIWSYPGADADLPEREGCRWTFDDEGDYRVFDVPVRVATCTPDDPANARVLATIVVRDANSYHLEARIPEQSFVAGKNATLAIMRSIEWSH
jgi:hypothetical protein